MEIYELQISTDFRGQQRAWIVSHEGKLSLYVGQNTSNVRGYAVHNPLRKTEDFSMTMTASEEGERVYFNLYKLTEEDCKRALDVLGLAKLLAVHS